MNSGDGPTEDERIAVIAQELRQLLAGVHGQNYRELEAEFNSLEQRNKALFRSYLNLWDFFALVVDLTCAVLIVYVDPGFRSPFTAPAIACAFLSARLWLRIRRRLQNTEISHSGATHIEGGHSESGVLPASPQIGDTGMLREAGDEARLSATVLDFRRPKPLL